MGQHGTSRPIHPKAQNGHIEQIEHIDNIGHIEQIAYIEQMEKEQIERIDN